MGLSNLFSLERTTQVKWPNRKARTYTYHSVLSFAVLLVRSGVVYSRAFQISGTPAMLPMIDMLNHAAESSHRCNARRDVGEYKSPNYCCTHSVQEVLLRATLCRAVPRCAALCDCY